METFKKMDWTKPDQKISFFFTMKEALYLPSWNRMATVKDGIGDQQMINLIELFRKMDIIIRGFLGRPINVHVAFRSKSYNKLIGGATNSSHIQGMACDFSVKGMTCDEVRAKIVPKLEEWNLRCEDLPGSSWVHIDTRPVAEGGKRFFKP